MAAPNPPGQQVASRTRVLEFDLPHFSGSGHSSLSMPPGKQCALKSELLEAARLPPERISNGESKSRTSGCGVFEVVTIDGNFGQHCIDNDNEPGRHQKF
uniref:Uncharacterized protein n=1 Tax=Sphaerodactylus townsendi TaxID=933632 RepID=A0ACB8FSQ8_9SAUR